RRHVALAEGVDRHETGVEAGRKIGDAARVFTENISAEAIGAVVGAGERFRDLVIEAHGKHRSEDLLGPKRGIRTWLEEGDRLDQAWRAAAHGRTRAQRIAL